MVDWSLARQIARFASRGTDAPAAAPDLELDRRVDSAQGHVIGYTRLEPAQPVPAPEAVSRDEWAGVNIDSMATMLKPVTDRLDGRLGAAGPLAGALRMATGATFAAEVGLVVGYMSQRVLGQYELSLLQLDAPARLLFVAPNLEKAAHDLDVDRDAFLDWIVFHELTHALQFVGVPWLRGHLGGLLGDYLATMEVRIERGAAGGLPSMPNLQRLVENFREGGLAGLVQTREQRSILARVQAAMSIIEGYAEHVMDVVGADVLPKYEGLRTAMESRRRSRSAPERLLQKLLGLDMKMRQYEQGKAFCDAVVNERGIEALNKVWSAPEALPTPAEIKSPGAWIARVDSPPAAAA
jgi:coenzyme F420 biosynthesis associated uncharacterized protein